MDDIQPLETEKDQSRVLTRLWDWKDITPIIAIFIFLYIVSQTAAFFLSGATVDLATGDISNEGDPFRLLIFALVGTMFATLIPYFIVNAVRQRHSFAQLGFKPLTNGWGWTSVWLGIAAALIRMAIGAGLLELFPTLAEGAEDLSEMFTFDLMWQTVVVGLLATFVVPVYEEIFFRGLLHNGLANRLGMWGAIIISSALFGVFHGFPIQIITAFLLGLVLGWLYEKTDNLWAPIICHVVNNGIAMGLSLISVFMGWEF